MLFVNTVILRFAGSLFDATILLGQINRVPSGHQTAVNLRVAPMLAKLTTLSQHKLFNFSVSFRRLPRLRR
jgi:hypothetical protein